MNKLIHLAKALYNLGLLSDSRSIMKLGGDAEYRFSVLASANFYL